MIAELMRSEMAQQPAVLAALVRRWPDIVDVVSAAVPAQPRGVTFIARGSSDNAALLGRYAVEIFAGVPASLAAPSVSTRYESTSPYRDQLIVAVSQSGRTPEIASAAASLRGEGSCVLAITNGADNPLAAMADVHLDVAADDERAVPATKTVTAQMLLMLTVAEGLARRTGGDAPVAADMLARLPDAIARVLDDTSPPARIVEGWGSAPGLQVVARGLVLGGALEAALKIRETTGVFAQGMSAADLVHGPIAALRPGLPVWTIDGGGPVSRDVAQLNDRLSDAGVEVIRSTRESNCDLPLPAALPEVLQALAAAVRGQQLALAWSLARGLDPDAPAGLSKVTVTR